MSMKKTKKTLVAIVTMSVTASILMSAAAAEEIDFNNSFTNAETSVAAVIMLPPEESFTLPVVELPLVADSSVQERSGTVSDAVCIAPAPVPDNTAVITENDTEIYVSHTEQPSSESKPDLLALAGQTIADFSKQFDGFRYVYGAASPKSGFDCSGLVYYVYTHFGYTLPRTASRQSNNGDPVELQDLQPGDLVFFATAGGRSVSHVGIFIGDNQFIHAATSRHGVMISSLDNSYWSKAFVSATRIVTPQSVLQLFGLPALLHITY